jgi:2,5-dihydroxypyridine 5,6-dioxygenase
MGNDFADLVALFKDELELCQLARGETVGIFSEAGARREYAGAFAQAASELGAPSFHIDLPVARPRDLSEALGGREADRGLASVPGAVEAFKRCDLMIDLMLILYEHELDEIRAAGTRVLSCVEPANVLLRMRPVPEDRLAAEDALGLIGSARTIVVTSAAGTDITYTCGTYRPFCQYGFVDEPGRWDHFPSTLVVHCPDDGGSNGRIVLAPGDLLWPMGRRLSSPVEVGVRQGRIESIEGGAEAEALRTYMEGFDDPRAFEMSHVGWGLNGRSAWVGSADETGTIGMDSRSYLASVMIATGPNAEFGGSNTTPCHIDMPLRDCTLSIDGETVVRAGTLVPRSTPAL